MEPGARRFAAAAVAGLGLWLCAAPASAGTFHVYGLGMNGAGCGHGWIAHSTSNKFVQVDRCSSWDVRSNRDGRAIPEGAAAVASMYTAPGARFIGFEIKSRGTARNGLYWLFSVCATSYDNCRGFVPQQGSWPETHFRLGTLLSPGSPLYGRHVFAGLRCYQKSCPDSSSAGRAGDVTHIESHGIVDDYTPPAAPSLSGVSSGWNSGQKQLAYTAFDAGSGVESVTLTIDAALQRTNRHWCARLPGGGYWNPVPCAAKTGAAFTLNQPGQLADGRHTLSVTTADAGGATASAGQVFWVDNNAPGQPLSPAVVGGDDWRSTNDFAVTWQNPGQGSGSPIVAANHKVGSAPTTATDGTRVGAGGIARLDNLKVPGDGTWTLYVWLRDEAGNANPGAAAQVPLRLDSTPPALAFADERSEHDPARVAVGASDAGSGVAGGLIEIRRQGAAEWRPLETRREGSDLVAAVPDGRLRRGTYELRATAWDGAGNRATSALRADGGQMVLELPLRGGTRMRAVLSRSARARRARPSVRVGYRRRAWLRGALRSGGGVPLGDTRVAILARRWGGRRWRRLTEVVTNARGRYRVPIPRGPSREIRPLFPGNRLLRPAADIARLRVGGWASLALRPRRLRRGGTIRFRGRVGLYKARVPRKGKLVQIQYLDGREWRPAVKLARTRRNGRFAVRYRFRRISRPTRIFFRMLVPAEGGWPYATGTSKVRVAHVRP